MTKKQAIDILKEHNRWRRVGMEHTKQTPLEAAIDIAILLLSKPAKPKCKHPNCKGGRIKTWSRKGFVSCLDCKVKPAKRRVKK